RGLLLGIASCRTDTERTQHSRKTFGRTARISVTTNVSDSSDLSQIHQTPETPRPIEELMPWIVGKACEWNGAALTAEGVWAMVRSPQSERYRGRVVRPWRGAGVAVSCRAGRPESWP